MQNQIELLKEAMEKILAEATLPAEGEELVRDITAALQKLLRRGCTMLEVAEFLRLILRWAANGSEVSLSDTDDAADMPGTEREEDGDPAASEISFELSMLIEGLSPKAISTFLNGSVVRHSAVVTNEEEEGR